VLLVIATKPAQGKAIEGKARGQGFLCGYKKSSVESVPKIEIGQSVEVPSNRKKYFFFIYFV
jgi:hypothetical protein